MAVARKDWELPNSRRRGRESVLTPVLQRLFPLIIFPGERAEEIGYLPVGDVGSEDQNS